jgi:hypothetical protein
MDAGGLAADRVAADGVAEDGVAADRVWAMGDASATAARPATDTYRTRCMIRLSSCPASKAYELFRGRPLKTIRGLLILT